MSKLDKDKEQAKLELEMKKRRERIEQWRAEKKKKEMDANAEKEEPKVNSEAKKWSLEEEESDEEENSENGNANAEEEDEVDPLDAYMTEVSKEVRKIKGGLNLKNSKVFKKPGAQPAKEEGNGEAPPKKKGLMIMTGVAKKKPELKSVKPDVMEQNQDGLEYSGEEETRVEIC